MPSFYVPHERVERLIALGRSVMAATALIAFWLDPPTPDNPVIPSLLRAYIVYSVLVTIVVFSRGPMRLAGTLTHVADVVVFTILILLAGGAMSPFFVYFVFSLITATLRWQWRGTLLTGVAVLVIFIMLAVGEWGTDAATIEVNRVVIRGVYLGVAALLIGYMGAHQERLQRDLAKLAAWSGHPPRDVEAAAREVLERSVSISRAGRGVLVWEEDEEPWVNVAQFDGSFRYDREGPDVLERLVPGDLADAAFVCEDAAARSPVVLCSAAESVVRWTGSPLQEAFRKRFRIRSVLSGPVAGDDFRGRLFLLGLRSDTTDDLRLGEILAQHAAAHLNQAFLIRRLRDAAASDERVRLARDLHDGVLQSLAAGALQLEAAGQLVDRDPQQARVRLAEIGRMIAAEQGELRAFISELRPHVQHRASSGTFLSRVEQLTSRLAQQWQIRVDVSVGTIPAEPIGRLALELYRLIHETVVNAARHARASHVRVELEGASGAIRIIVMDDGRGFPFKGYFDLAALAHAGRGPKTLVERTTVLDGRLLLHSTAEGSRLEFEIPLTPRRRREDLKPQGPGAQLPDVLALAEQREAHESFT